MFDKLVESALEGADLTPRRKIFVATFLLVGSLFATALVAGIYAADFTLGTDNFDIAAILAPLAATKPDKPREPELEKQQSSQPNTNDRTTRRVIMASTDDPSRVPDTTSTEVNRFRSISPDRYKDVKLGSVDLDPAGQGGQERAGNPIGSSSAASAYEPDEKSTDAPPAPPKVEKKGPPVSIGVANGRAIDLPKPAYPPAAISVGAAGVVNVQVLIDETGTVVSAKALSGHIMLRRVAEQAAWKARFTPTKLSNVPVKVTGVIVYNFTR